MEQSAVLTIDKKNFSLPIVKSVHGEQGIDIQKLRAESGYVTYDSGYGNTGSCQSAITFIDGDQGTLLYRGYPIEQLAGKITFLDAAHLIIYGQLPKVQESDAFADKIERYTPLHEKMGDFFQGFPADSSPMAVLASIVSALGCYYPEFASNDRKQDLTYFDEAAAILMSKIRTIAAVTYRKQRGLPFIFPKPDLPYAANFLHMMFSQPYDEYIPSQEVTQALDLFLLLHGDHEQNCSTSTVRMVASGGANLFASIAAGISALWGPLHGGANTAVVEMLQSIYESGDDGTKFIKKAKSGEARLMGFGHRVYKNFDPRSKILAQAAETILHQLGIKDPLLDIARRLADIALQDDYFISRKLYPNVDFYSGILLKAMGIPTNMFTVLFAIGRMPGWIANWKECAEEPKARIYRPRQIYVGPGKRSFDSNADSPSQPQILNDAVNGISE